MPTALCHDVYLLWAGEYEERELIGIYTRRDVAEREIVSRAMARDGKGLSNCDIVIMELHGDLQDLEITAGS